MKHTHDQSVKLLVLLKSLSLSYFKKQGMYMAHRHVLATC